MNNPSPLIPQGSLLEQKNRGRARVRLAVFFVLSIHVIGLMALLMQGCRRETPTDMDTMNTDTNLPPAPPAFETPQSYPPMGETNVPAYPPETEASNPPSGVPGNVPSNALPPSTYTPPPIEQQPVPPSMAPAAAGQEYAIKKGDTFSSIAHDFHVSVKAIQDANPNVDPRRLQIGQKIQIPAPAPSTSSSTAPATGAGTNAGSSQQVYKVKSGDTLTHIANLYHTTVKALRSENNLTSDRIVVGQVLKIPASAPTTGAQ